ncbi:MAG: class I SAM-dependent methyltransferase [Candidatus Tumulicola sp.]
MSAPKPGSQAEAFFNTVAEWCDSAERPIDIAPFLTGSGVEIRRYLDLGAGTGQTIENVLARVRRESILAVDVSSKMLDLLRAKHPAVETTQRDIVEYVREDGSSFDLITAIGVPEFVSNFDLGLVISGAAKALNPGGPFAFTYEPIVASVRTQRKRVETSLGWVGSPLTWYRRNPGPVRLALKRFGFKILFEIHVPQAYKNEDKLPVAWEFVVAARSAVSGS